MKRLFFAVFAVAVAATMPSAANAQDKISPETVTGTTSVDTAKAKALFDKGIAFVDVRSDKDWDAGRIPGAVHIELKSKFNEASLADVAKGKDKEVVLYCNGHKCMRSSEAAEMAVKWGFSKVYYYRDGFPAWQSAGNPVE